MPKRKLSEKTRAVITGAGSGIGRAFALELAKRGGEIVVSDVDLPAAEETVALIEAFGGRAISIKCDVSKIKDVEKLANQSEHWFGQTPNFVINNAGVGLGGTRVEDISLEDWQWIVGINLWGVIHGCRVFVPKLRELGDGAILNVASAASFGAAPYMGAYNATKASVLAISETLAAELKGSGVQVGVMCPTVIKSNIVANAKMGDLPLESLQNMMDKGGMEAEVAINRVLNAMDRGKLHLLPQTDAKIVWFAKRMAPALFTKGMGAIGKRVPINPDLAEVKS